MSKFSKSTYTAPFVGWTSGCEPWLSLQPAAPPTQNADGSTLTDLSGYKIHYGTSSKNYSESLAVNTAGVTSYQVEGLPAGKLYFAMTAVNAAGAESDYSSEVSVTVN